MLLIGQPKSASTSLLKTLGKMFKIKFQNGLGKEFGWEYCENFTEIQKYHDTTIKRNYAFLKTWILKKDHMLKEHILPTKHHQDIIKKINGKILILLRRPEDSLDNYKRLYKSYKENKLSAETINELMPYRFVKINFKQLLSDLMIFHKEWIEFDYNKKLIITYKELVLDYYSTIKKIFKFWNYNIPKNILPLFRSKGNHGYSTYTGIGVKRLKGELK